VNKRVADFVFHQASKHGLLDCVYLHTLRTAKHQQTILRVLGVHLVDRATSREINERSLSPADIEAVLNLQPGDVRQSLSEVPFLVDTEDHINILHASFSDFLLDKSRSMELFIEKKNRTQYWRQGSQR